MKAVIKIGGKQHVVAEGDTLTVEKQTGNPVVEVLALVDGEKTVVGNPVVTGATVKLEVVTEQQLAPKVVVMKFQSKKRVKKQTGHRQQQSVVRVAKITTK